MNLLMNDKKLGKQNNYMKELKKLYSNIEKLNNMPDTLENHRAWKSTVDRILEIEGEKEMQENNYTRK